MCPQDSDDALGSDNTDAFAVTAATWLASTIGEVLHQRGVCHLAVSGGSTPAPTFEALSEMRVEWDGVHVWQVDERVAPDGDPARNAVGLLSSLVDRVSLPEANLHLMPVTVDDLGQGAADYAAALHARCAGILDIVHLGLGADGHTASWPPGDPVIDVDDRDIALSGEYQGHIRMTMTVPCVNRAHRRLFLVRGPDKAEALAALLENTGTIPANRVTLTETTVLSN